MRHVLPLVFLGAFTACASQAPMGDGAPTESRSDELPGFTPPGAATRLVQPPSYALSNPTAVWNDCYGADRVRTTWYAPPASELSTIASCYPYRCDATTRSCAAKCTTSDQCMPGARCSSGACVVAAHWCSSETTLGQPGQQTTVGRYSLSNVDSPLDCAPYTCDNATGSCLRKCFTVNDCDQRVPLTCSPEGSCIQQ